MGHNIDVNVFYLHAQTSLACLCVCVCEHARVSCVEDISLVSFILSISKNTLFEETFWKRKKPERNLNTLNERSKCRFYIVGNVLCIFDIETTTWKRWMLIWCKQKKTGQNEATVRLCVRSLNVYFVCLKLNDNAEKKGECTYHSTETQKMKG